MKSAMWGAAAAALLILAGPAPAQEPVRLAGPRVAEPMMMGPGHMLGAAPAAACDRACLLALTYLLHLVPSGLGPPIGPLELPGGATFFRGHHMLPPSCR